MSASARYVKAVIWIASVSASYILWGIGLGVLYWVIWPVVAFVWRVLTDPVVCLWIGLAGLAISLLLALVGGMARSAYRLVQRWKGTHVG